MDRGSVIGIFATIGFILLMVAILAFVHQPPGTAEGGDETDLPTPGPITTDRPGTIQSTTPDQPIAMHTSSSRLPVTTIPSPATPPGNSRQSTTASSGGSYSSTTISPVATSTPTGPASFQISVSPVNTAARAGDRVLYTMEITAENGFSQPVSLCIDVNALLVFRQTYDLGVVQPPFPNTLTYEFIVPGNVPSGVTINGLLRASGGGIERQQTLSLQVQ